MCGRVYEIYTDEELCFHHETIDDQREKRDGCYDAAIFIEDFRRIGATLMNLRGVTFGLFTVLIAMLTFTPAAAGAGKCESLATIVLPDTTITLAQSVAPGALSLADTGDSAQQQIATVSI
jgi:hypothetical protein